MDFPSITRKMILNSAARRMPAWCTATACICSKMCTRLRTPRFRAYPAFRGKGVASWLYAIAHNTCLDVLKSARYRREMAVLDDPETTIQQTDSAPTPEAAYLEKAENDRLWQMVMALSQEQQTILSLYYGEQMTYEQIAAATDMRIGTVKSRLSRAKEALAKKLEEKS